MSVGGKNEKDEGLVESSIHPGVPTSSPGSPSSPSDENHAQIASDTDGKLDREVGAHASSCSPSDDAPLVITESKTVETTSVNEFFDDDPTSSYKPLPDHDLSQSPCYHIINKEGNYFFCKLHSGIRNIHLESIEHHIKYKDPEVHRTELLRLESDLRSN